MKALLPLLLTGALALPGDSNCDGQSDLSDVVHLLLWLYQAGEAPCAPCSELQADGEALVGIVERLEAENRELRAELEFCDPIQRADLSRNVQVYRCRWLSCIEGGDPLDPECGVTE